MAMIDHRPQLPFGALTAHVIGSGVRSLAARFNHWRDVRRTVRILSRLDQKQLDDLGLKRGDVETFAKRGRF